MLVHAMPSNATYDFAADVRDGLTRTGQKELPSKYLYDDVGSALFEVISRLPQYGLTRADERLLRRHSDEIVDLLGGPVAVAELGSGTGRRPGGCSKLSVDGSAPPTILSKYPVRLWSCASAN